MFMCPCISIIIASSKGSEPQDNTDPEIPTLEIMNLGCRGHNATSWPLDDVGRWWCSILWTLDRASLGFGVPKTTEISAAAAIQQQFSNSAAIQQQQQKQPEKTKLKKTNSSLHDLVIAPPLFTADILKAKLQTVTRHGR